MGAGGRKGGGSSERSFTLDRSTCEGDRGLGILDTLRCCTGCVVLMSRLGNGGGILFASWGCRKALDLDNSSSDVASLL